MLQPGTSALFLIVEDDALGRVTETLSPFGGRELTTSLSQQTVNEMHEALHGAGG